MVKVAASEIFSAKDGRAMLPADEVATGSVLGVAFAWYGRRRYRLAPGLDARIPSRHHDQTTLPADEQEQI